MASSECKNTPCILIKKEGLTCHLMLNRPRKKNAINKAMIDEITDFLIHSQNDLSFRTLVISGSGNYFSSGADLNWMKAGLEQSKEANIKDAELFSNLYHQLFNYPKPVIAHVEKAALGGALGFVACADISIAKASATFGLPETKRGLIPATIAPYILNKTGITNTKLLMLTGDSFSAKRAKEMGLLQYIDKNEKDSTILNKLLNNIESCAPLAIQTTKQLINTLQHNLTPESTISHCNNLIATARCSKEGQEGIHSFIEKRNPYWLHD